MKKNLTLRKWWICLAILIGNVLNADQQIWSQMYSLSLCYWNSMELARFLLQILVRYSLWITEKVLAKFEWTALDSRESVACLFIGMYSNTIALIDAVDGSCCSCSVYTGNELMTVTVTTDRLYNYNRQPARSAYIHQTNCVVDCLSWSFAVCCFQSSSASAAAQQHECVLAHRIASATHMIRWFRVCWTCTPLSCRYLLFPPAHMAIL